jgi:tetratricopeptide (TPR) repeat protein
LEIFEEDDEMSYYLGNILQRENRIAEAINAYSDAIAYSKINGEDYPLVWAYHFNRGNCFLKSNQFEKAIPDYTYAIGFSPDNPDISYQQGLLLITKLKRNQRPVWIGMKRSNSEVKAFNKVSSIFLSINIFDSYCS